MSFCEKLWAQSFGSEILVREELTEPNFVCPKTDLAITSTLFVNLMLLERKSVWYAAHDVLVQTVRCTARQRVNR